MSNSTNTLSPETAGQSLTAEHFLNHSAACYQRGQLNECIEAARSAIQLKPDYAEAWSNMCAAFNNLGCFEEGRMAGEEAVRLAPGFELAKNNLDWSIRGLESSSEAMGKASSEPPQAVAASAMGLPSSRKSMRRVRSYDLFDTLIARRCRDPHRIFSLVEKRSGVRGFAEARKQAESAVMHKAYTIDDIYRQLATMLDCSASRVESLRSLELCIEGENLFPIREMVEQVRPDDVIVSDMYLPQEFVRDVVTRIVGACPLFLSSGGKASGEVWRTLKEKYELASHTGDNHFTDFLSPTRHGVPAFLTSIARFSEAERQVGDLGFEGLALTMREARLTSYHPDPASRQLQLFQSQWNFPLLFLGSIALHRHAVSHRTKTVLMSSRDCYLWQHLLKNIRDLQGGTYTITYFLTSRLCRAFPSKAYLSYANELLAEPAIIVDICGTGWSLKRLIAVSKRPETPIFLLILYDNPAAAACYESLAPAAANSRILHCLTGNPATIECANYARHAMVTDMVETDKGFAPVYSSLPGVSWENIPQIQIQHEAFLHTIGLMPLHDFERDFQVGDAQLQSALEVCLRGVGKLASVFDFAKPFGEREEANTEHMLRELASASRAREAPQA